MIDEDLHAIHGILERMEPNAKIEIGRMTCSAAELRVVVQEALAARQQRKIAELCVDVTEAVPPWRGEGDFYISWTF